MEKIDEEFRTSRKGVCRNVASMTIRMSVTKIDFSRR